MKKTSKKSYRSFFLGVLAGFVIWLLLDLVFNWDENVKDFMDGYNAGKNKLENTK